MGRMVQTYETEEKIMEFKKLWKKIWDKPKDKETSVIIEKNKRKFFRLKASIIYWII